MAKRRAKKSAAARKWWWRRLYDEAKDWVTTAFAKVMAEIIRS